MLHWSSLSHPFNWERMHTPKYLWRAVAFSLILLALIVGTTLSVLSSSQSIGKAQKALAQANVVDTVLSYVNSWRDDDPIVSLPNGGQAKSSNAYGVELGGVRYFYQPIHHISFDPLRRGEATEYELVAVIAPGSSDEVIIYRIKK